jgi:hypothetical protein
METGNVEHFELCLDNDGLWKRLPLKWMFEYFSDREDYEKLTLLKKVIDKHFVADVETQKKLNSKLEKNLYKMDKKSVLDIVTKVKTKSQETYVHEIMYKIETHVNNVITFSYHDTMMFIESLKSGKLGGVYAQANKSIEFLKNELKSLYRETKKTGKRPGG